MSRRLAWCTCLRGAASQATASRLLGTLGPPRRPLSILVAALSLSSCGYHFGGKADLMPKGVHTIAIPQFSTLSMHYKLADLLPQQIGREFNARTRFRIVDDPNVADAVLNGTLNSVSVGPVVFDPTTSRASAVSITVVLTINLRERATGRLLYSRAGWFMRERYQIASDPHQFIDESGPAVDRLGRDLASVIVSSVVENF